jgi:hypothetical protein
MYDVPPAADQAEMLGEAMIRVTSGAVGRPRLAVSEWRRRCEASLRASRARR